jgi:urease accessory protein
VKVHPGFRTAIPAALGGLLGVVPRPAFAHLVTTGLGPVYDGVSHFLMSFEDLLPVAAMALLAGLNGPAGARRALFVLPAAWLVGGLGGLVTGSALLPGTATAASALVLGGLVAADRRLSPTMISVLAAVLGLMHGWLNGAGIAAANREGLAILGMGGVAFVIFALLAALVASLRVDVARIAVRVAGSWIAAIGLLLIGWQLRG